MQRLHSFALNEQTEVMTLVNGSISALIDKAESGEKVIYHPQLRQCSQQRNIFYYIYYFIDII